MKTGDQRLCPRGEAGNIAGDDGMIRGNDGALKPADDHLLQRVPLIMRINRALRQGGGLPKVGREQIHARSHCANSHYAKQKTAGREPSRPA